MGIIGCVKQFAGVPGVDVGLGLHTRHQRFTCERSPCSFTKKFRTPLKLRQQHTPVSHGMATTEGKVAELPAELRYIQYTHSLEKQYLPSIRALISKDLSEPYSIYVYRYFLYQWGELCFMVRRYSLIKSGIMLIMCTGNPARDPSTHRRRNQQARNPPLPFSTHASRLHSHAGRILRLPGARDRDRACAQGD